jgi:hypothetical protein
VLDKQHKFEGLDELRLVWHAAEGDTGQFGRMVRFILLTSARRTEASAMAWTELNGEWTLPDESGFASAA